MKPGDSKADKVVIRDEADASSREVKRQGDADKAFATEADRLRDRHISDPVRPPPTYYVDERNFLQRWWDFIRGKS